MTKKQFGKRFHELTMHLQHYIENKAEWFIESGAIDLKSYKNDHRLPMIILKAILIDASDNFKSLRLADEKEVKNLLNF
ncbi:hypothetical protein [Candidatus Kuenenia stuttgartiensis]|uniref:Uncharacterized protein n=1 Tax=Kuenenia stuttgartiensis TaxID=174633 RepID=Q1Q5C7_KUEST|nr:hypothetical protein [Candidatus Kuenenia stuttgartiensis]CAJ75218.1 unknown protein [Candidatus Kuenenia stuttgartiensis]